ncbi:MAG: YbdD/YjiX family protein [Rhodospirillaceae bacterium]|nr:YbdD/YjiX family protein [Rhodospirillaceae bacterium]
MKDDPYASPRTDQAAPDFWSRVRQTFRLVVHIPDYDTYVRHLQANEPGKPVPTYEEFITICQERRFSNGYLIGKC